MFELTGGLPLAPEVTAAPPTASSLAWSHEPVEFEPPSRDGLEVIAARPLFSPSRQPFVAAEEEAAPASVQSLPPLQLIGVLLTEQQRAALVRAADEAGPTWVREGTEVLGWRVEKIEESQIQLRGGDRLETVGLRPDTAVSAKERWTSSTAEPPDAAGEEAAPVQEPDEADADPPEEKAD